MELIEKQELLQTAVLAARAAGQVILGYYQTAVANWEKSPNNPVTKADLEADALLREQLLAAAPRFGWLSEETADDRERLKKEFCWIVDPLDGTQEFIDGLDQFAVSIGLAQDGQPLLGVVYNPATGELFSSIADHGFEYNGDASRPLSERTRPGGASILASDTEIKAGMWRPFPEFQLLPLGSAAYKLARLAAGYGDAYISLKPKREWDVCAGVGLVQAAGGRVTDLKGLPIRFNRPDVLVGGIVAANPFLHDAVCREMCKKIDGFNG